MNKSTGFTLIELLLVLAIIGIISAIAIPALLSQRARARDKAATTNMTGSMGDLIGTYDKAKEDGAVVTTRMGAVVITANLANKNPWDPTLDAYAAFDSPGGTLGEAGFVYVAPVGSVPGSLTGNAIVKNQVAGSTAAAGHFSVTKVSNID
jgi:prepilin-type N-terminal cleavage/methylation domain-containing protein